MSKMIREEKNFYINISKYVIRFLCQTFFKYKNTIDFKIYLLLNYIVFKIRDTCLHPHKVIDEPMVPYRVCMIKNMTFLFFIVSYPMSAVIGFHTKFRIEKIKIIVDMSQMLTATEIYLFLFVFCLFCLILSIYENNQMF